jgi:hypothetical protein
MATRVLGPTGSRRRRRFLLASLLLVACSALLLVGSARAVHDTGAFQLDGDAQKSTSPSGTQGTTAPDGDDWDNICASNPTTCQFATGFSASPSTTATQSAHVADGNNNATIFTGGGSKDPNDLNNWQWKNAGGLPDKDNLQHGFAARYSLPSTGPNDTTCPSLTAGTNTCKLLYFGSDRFDNSGDAQEGFWFFQKPVCFKSDGTFGNTSTGTCSGTAQHTPGDLLILSDFSNGGGTSTINIYKWVASGGDVAPNLLSLGGGTSQACNKTGPPLVLNDPFCGAVNPTDGTIAPWTFTDKSGFHTYLNGEFYEGGVNLSSPSINLGGECFASFASETRSSTSPTATLKDVVLGGFGNCTSSTVTTPEDSSGTSISSVSLGTTGSVQVKDLATVSGGGGSAVPTGSVRFYICGPQSTNALAQCNAAATPLPSPPTFPAAPSNGTLVSTNTLVAGAGTTATATSDLVTITVPGHYCFRGDYSGDSNYPESSDNSLTECFTVTDTSSVLTDQTWVPRDHAQITSTGGSALDGSVVFTLYSNGTCDPGTANANVLYTNGPTGTPVSGTSPKIVDSADPGVHVNATTTWSWKVVYTSNNANAGSTSSCESTALTVTNNPGYTPLP